MESLLEWNSTTWRYAGECLLEEFLEYDTLVSKKIAYMTWSNSKICISLSLSTQTNTNMVSTWHVFVHLYGPNSAFHEL